MSYLAEGQNRGVANEMVTLQNVVRPSSALGTSIPTIRTNDGEGPLVEADREVRLMEMRDLIVDGHKPACPLCDSELRIEKSDGASGSRAYKYSCANTECELAPGIAHIPWYRVLQAALQLRIAQLVLAGLASVTLASLVGVTSGMIGFSASDAQPESERMVIQAISIPLIVWDADDLIVEINESACRFIQVGEKEMLGKTPAYLRAEIAGLLENPAEWMAEQNQRELATFKDLLTSPSKVPMILKASHTEFSGSWYIETNRVEIHGDVFWVTRYFQKH